jgi:exopolysaccharide biosynthesis polyprenyl glycosylphosphotransferase
VSASQAEEAVTVRPTAVVSVVLDDADVASRQTVPAPRATSLSWLLACVVVDGAALMGAVVADRLGARATNTTSVPALWLAAFAVATFVLLQVRGMYRPRMRLRVLDDVRVLLTTTAVTAMAVLSLRVVFADSTLAGDQMVRLWAFTAAYLVAGRTALSWAEGRARRRGQTGIPTLIVGAGHVGRLTARRLLAEPELGLRPVGFLDKEPVDDEEALHVPVLGSSWDLERVVAAQDVGHVVLAFSTAPHAVMLRVARRCEELGVAVSYVPRLFEQVGERVSVEHLGGLPLLSVERASPRGWQFALKYAADRVVAAFFVALLLPVLLVSAAAVWLSLGRPILFRQRRVGRDGRFFDMLKFRTMRAVVDQPVTAPALRLPPDTAPGGVEGDDRRTRVGTILRKTSLDELPQLLNVLAGQMSIVGPRPERPEFVELFRDRIYRYPERHRVKAGITGWAQVNGLRGKTSLSDRIEWDNYYIENWSLWLDVRILVATARAVFDGRRIE